MVYNYTSLSYFNEQIFRNVGVALIGSVLFGCGRFGSLFLKYFGNVFDLRIYDASISIRENIKINNLSEITAAEFIFFAVPISSLESLFNEITPFVSPDTVLSDLCSVKEYPVSLMKKYFPKNEIIGSHPLFGPDSTTDGLTGRQVVLTAQKRDTPAYIKLKVSFASAGLQIIEMGDEEHDRQMAWTLCLTQFIGRGLGTLPLPQNSIGTKGYFDLLDIVNRANADTLQLYIDMNQYNRFSAQMRSQVLAGMTGLNDMFNSIPPEKKKE